MFSSNKINAFKPYKKSYKNNTHQEVKGWRGVSETTQKLLIGVKVSVPFRVSSLSELHKDPRYPDYHPKKLFPLLSTESKYSQKRGKFEKFQKKIMDLHSERLIYPNKNKNLDKKYSLSTKASNSASNLHSIRPSFDLNFGNLKSETEGFEKNLKGKKWESWGNNEICEAEDGLSYGGNEKIMEFNGDLLENDYEFSKKENILDIGNALKKEFKGNREGEETQNCLVKNVEILKLPWSQEKPNKNVKTENYISDASLFKSKFQLKKTAQIPELQKLYQSPELEKKNEVYVKSLESSPKLVLKEKNKKDLRKNINVRIQSKISGKNPELLISPKSQVLEKKLEISQKLQGNCLSPIQEERITSNTPYESSKLTTENDPNIENSQEIVERPDKTEFLNEIEQFQFAEDLHFSNISRNQSIKSFDPHGQSIEERKPEISNPADITKPKQNPRKYRISVQTSRFEKVNSGSSHKKNLISPYNSDSASPNKRDSLSQNKRNSLFLYKRDSFSPKKNDTNLQGKNEGKSPRKFDSESPQKKKLKSAVDSPKKFGIKISVIPPTDFDKKEKTKNIKRTSTLSANFGINPLIKKSNLLSVNRQIKRTSTELIEYNGDFVRSHRTPSPYANQPGINRFINNYSLSVINQLHFLVLNLQDSVNDISSDLKTVDIAKLNFLQLTRKKRKSTIKAQKMAMKKRMKIELSLALNPMKSRKGAEKKKSLIVENIKNSIFSDGIKSDLIAFLKDKKDFNRKSVLSEMTKIMKKRLRTEIDESSESLSSSESEFCESSELSDSDSSEKSVSFSEMRRRNMEKLKYEMKRNNSYASQLSVTNSEASRLNIGKEEWNNASFCSNLEEFEENRLDIKYELEGMTWYNKKNTKQMLFSSQVNYSGVDRSVIMSCPQYNNIEFDDDIDIKNLESTVLKNRFLTEKNINETNRCRYLSHLVVDLPDSLNPEEKRKYEVAMIRKHLKKVRQMRLKPEKISLGKKVKTFSNLSKIKKF